MTKTATPTGEQRTVPLSAIHVQDGFNPRGDAERAQIDSLADSMRLHGVLIPLIVLPKGDDRYELVAGERRYRAAAKAGIREVPVVLRDAKEDGETLELALVENIARVALDPVEEAHGFKRLMDERGLTRKGVAERLSIAQKRVTERLQILELDSGLHPRIASGEIPPGVIKALCSLARLHDALPALAVGAVGREVDGWQEETTWSDLADDPIGVLVEAQDALSELPSEVYVPGNGYPLSRFSLSDKATKDLATFVELTNADPEALSIRFEAPDVKQATALDAYYASKSGYVGLIVGQEVADRLVEDVVGRALKDARARQRRSRETAAAGSNGSGGQAGGGESEPTEAEQAEQRRQERQERDEARRKAVAFNHELGAACVKHLSRIRVDEQVVKLVACVDLHGDLGKIASRGARYGFPGWTREVEGKGGRRKVEYHDLAGATKAAREYLAGAKSAAGVAGRAVAMIAMARYANEEAVAQSSRSMYDVSIRDYQSSGVPWSAEAIDIIDAICVDRLPDELTKDVREDRAAQLERVRLVRDAVERVEGLSSEERAKLVEEVEERLGDQHYQAWELHHRVRELDAAEAEAKVSADAEAAKAA